MALRAALRTATKPALLADEGPGGHTTQYFHGGCGMNSWAALAPCERREIGFHPDAEVRDAKSEATEVKGPPPEAKEPGACAGGERGRTSSGSLRVYIV
jgi:hypothetical protein